MLEQSDMRGHIICVDGSPDYTSSSAMGKTIFGENLFGEIIKMADKDIATAEYRSLLEDLDWKEIIEKLHNFVKNQENFDVSFAQKMLNDMIKRGQLVFDYDDSHLVAQIDSKVTLIKAIDSITDDLDETYGLNKYAKNGVTVKCTPGNHKSMFEFDELSDLINESFM
jgi:hypothetical protein